MSSPLFDDWTWSYSRIKLFEQCPYAFALKYLYEERGQSNFYAEFGTYMHHIHELFYNGALKQEELVPYYIENFEQMNRKLTGTNKSKYFLDGLNYFEGGIQIVPSSIVSVEQQMFFTVGGYKFTGFIDLLYRNEDGTLTIVDHKSHNLKPMSNRTRQTASDKEMDDMLKQMYLYAHAVHQMGLGNVGVLTFNCFRISKSFENIYSKAKEDEAVAWAVDTIKRIENSPAFMPNNDWFYCNNLCDHRAVCEYR